MPQQIKGVHISSFICGRDNNGGVRRSRQISEFREAEGAQVIALPLSPREPLRSLATDPLSILEAIWLTVPLFIKWLSVRGALISIVYGAWLLRIIKKSKSGPISIEISPNLSIILGNILASKKINYITFPHNIEFMVPGQLQRAFRCKEAEFAAEMRIYRRAQAVLTISGFDQAILKCLGIENTSILSYQPVAADRQILEHIRRERAFSEKHGILIVGSIENPPTFRGIVCLLDLIGRQSAGPCFSLAGYGTERLKSRAPSRVIVHGTVSEGEMKKLMIECKATVIYQPPTSGMLTRLVESIIAGIPIYVLGGYLQARELQEFNVQSISDISEIAG